MLQSTRWGDRPALAAALDVRASQGAFFAAIVPQGAALGNAWQRPAFTGYALTNVHSRGGGAHEDAPHRSFYGLPPNRPP